MEQEKSRSIWELLSDVFREIAVLWWVFGVLLEHEHRDYIRGIVICLGSMIIFSLSIVFEGQRDRMEKKIK